MSSEALLFGVLFGVGFLPLLGGPRYEAALVAGLIAPTVVAMSSALRVTRRLRLEGALSGAEVVGASLKWGVTHAAVIGLTAALHGLRSGFCEPGPGFALLALGPGIGVFLAAAWGATVGLLARSLRRSGLLLGLGALAGPLGTASCGLYDFWSSPAVYAFDPFVGYFAGPLYDTVIYDLGRMGSLRLGTLLWGASWVALISACRFRTQGGALLWQLRHPLLLGVFVPFLGVAAWRSSLASNLGLRTTRASLQRALPHVVAQGPCRVQFSAGVAPARATELAGECVGHLRQIRAYFGLSGPPAPVTVLLFADADEKWWHMGARTTYIAKPWRREVYLNSEAFPHPVLGHELAHVVAGEFGTGPLRVAGALSGLIPDPGRIEGFAVAASPQELGDATESQWSQTMAEMGVLPSVRDLFSLGFLGNSAVRSYAASGAFVDFLHRVYGPEVLRRFYGGADLPTLTQRSWTALDRDFRGALSRIALPQNVRLLAQERFTRPAVWGRRCPHAAVRKVEQASAVCGSAPQQVGALVQEALSLDASRQDDRTLEPLCLAQNREFEHALLASNPILTDPIVSAAAKSRLHMTRGDIWWQQGLIEQAREEFERLLDSALSDSDQRAVQIKLWALEQDPWTQERMIELLALGGAAPGQEPRLQELERDYERSNQPVLGYLLGLRLAPQEPERALEVLSSIVRAELPTEDLRVEAYRRILIVSCQLGNTSSLLDAQAWLLSHVATGPTRVLANRLPERCVPTQ